MNRCDVCNGLSSNVPYKPQDPANVTICRECLDHIQALAHRLALNTALTYDRAQVVLMHRVCVARVLEP